MTTDEAFEIIRVAIGNHPEKDGIPIATAILTITEELMSKLERIAVASETVANTTATDGYGYPYVRTMTST